jgi:NAD-dependent SIR2 family protein deacetylase
MAIASRHCGAGDRLRIANLVILTGAGVSAESGAATLREASGL